MTRQPQRLSRGDLIFTAGGGLVGALIRFGTSSPYAHTGVVLEVVETRTDGTQLLITAEAWPSRRKALDGPRIRHRDTGTDPVLRAHRVSPAPVVRDRVARAAELYASAGIGYGWGEILRIVAWKAGLRLRRWDSPTRMICSNHVAASVMAVLPEFADYLFPFAPYQVWPGYLEERLGVYLWDTTTNPTIPVISE